MGEFRNVNAACGHVRGDEKPDGALAQPGKDIFAAALGQVGGQLVGVESKALQYGGHEVHRSLGIAENDGGGRVFDFQNLDQRAILFHALAFAIEMLDFRHMDLRRGQGEHLGIGQEFSRQLEHMGRDR